jgi:hypothetical protein
LLLLQNFLIELFRVDHDTLPLVGLVA